MKSGVEFIAQERWRQQNQEGWTPKHDDQHKNGEIAKAAACYALPEEYYPWAMAFKRIIFWPWEMRWWKPSPEDRIKELTKAGALIAAEIDRLQRLRYKSEAVSNLTSKI